MNPLFENLIEMLRYKGSILESVNRGMIRQGVKEQLESISVDSVLVKGESVNFFGLFFLFFLALIRLLISIFPWS